MQRQGVRSWFMAATAAAALSALASCGDAGGGNVSFGGSQDFAAFRDAIARGQVPRPETLDSGGFFAEHFTSLPAPTCGQELCLHGMLSVSQDLARGGDWTLLQLAMNTPLDPDKVTRPPLDLAVVLDRSGSMGEGSKMAYARDGVKLLIDQLGPQDTFSLVAFDDEVERVFGPAIVTDKAKLKATVDGIEPRGSTNIYGALEAGYQAILAGGGETQLRRVIFLTDGLATAGNTNSEAIINMSVGYNAKYLGLTTIGLGTNVEVSLLRGLAERGGGNFYFVENPAAVTEVFTEELKFFVAPIAYDIDLSMEQFPVYNVVETYGTNLWKPTSTGGSVHLPVAYLTSRTTTMPDPMGGRRGGGAALIPEMKPVPGTTLSGPHGIARVVLEYRKPGDTVRQRQELVVNYNGTAGVAPEGGFYSDASIEKNTLVLDFFVAFREATKLAQKDIPAAHALLTRFKPLIVARLAQRTDADLLDDLTILQQYIDVLARLAPR